ncbi:MAG: septal ring lytic transglycosylase RlpA family protein [Methylococcaceae bacterium]
MKKLILALSMVVICSYFTNVIPTAEASGRHSSSKHHKAHKVKHHSKTGHHRHHGTTASWYGAQFHGKRTASGERFDMYAMTAASRTLPLSSYAEVTNLKNNRSVIVRINDRGPFHGSRAMDLSYSAAKQLGIKGTASVKITPLGNNPTLSQLNTRNKTTKRG